MLSDMDSLVVKVSCFSDKSKLRILAFLSNSGGRTIEEISLNLRVKPSTVYKYLQEMLKAGFVSRKKLPGKKGKYLFSVEPFSFEMNSQVIAGLSEAKSEKLLLIFDVDDTLIRRADIPEQLSKAGKLAIKEAQDLFASRGIQITYPPEELFSAGWIFSKYGNTIAWFISTWLRVAGAPQNEETERVVNKYVKEYFKRIEKTIVSCRAFKDVLPALEALNSRAIFAAMSNSSKKAVIETFKANNLLKFFIYRDKPLIVGGDEIPKSKETVLELMRMAGFKPLNCVLVGDSGSDIKVGREAGVPFNRTVAVYRKILPLEALRNIRPRPLIIESLLQLEQAI